jgi:hypothetical protein
MARKVVPALCPPESSGDRNGVAALILILWRGTIPGRKPTMGYPIPWCSRSGTDECAWQFVVRLDSQYRRTDLKLRRADVTLELVASVENSASGLFSYKYEELKWEDLVESGRIFQPYGWNIDH